MTRREEEMELVRKGKGGDAAAFAEIIRRYQNLVFSTVFQILRDRALAEDVAQEAFVKSFQSLQNLRTESSFPPWYKPEISQPAIYTKKGIQCESGFPFVIETVPKGEHHRGLFR